MADVMPSTEWLASASTDELAEVAANCLARLEPGRQPLPLFKELARLVVLSTVEVVPLRLTPAGTEVLLGKRSPEDPWWPNQWHLPGSVLLPTDKRTDSHDYTNPVRRILSTEFEGTVVHGTIQVFDAQRRGDMRGEEQTVFCLTEANTTPGLDEPAGGHFFNIADIPLESSGELIVGHQEIIDRALTHYQHLKS